MNDNEQRKEGAGGGRGGEGNSFSKEMKRNSFSLFFARPSSDRGSRQPSTTTTSARRHSLRPREQPPAFNYYYIRRHFIYYLYAPTTVTATPQSPTMTTNGRERSRRARAPHLQHRGRSALRWDCFVRVTPTAALCAGVLGGWRGTRWRCGSGHTGNPGQGGGCYSPRVGCNRPT